MGNYDLVCFDMDGTLTNLRSSWYWVHQCLGVDNDSNYHEYVNGNIDEMEFMRRDIALWKSAKPDISIGDLIGFFQSMPLVDGIQETILCLKENGMRSVIVSGGIDLAAKMIADEFGFDGYLADGVCSNPDGSLTGEGTLPVDLKDKGVNVLDCIEMYNTTRERTISIGNSYTDIAMFKRSGLSIAFNPTDEYTSDAADHVVHSRNIADVLDFILEMNQSSKSIG